MLSAFEYLDENRYKVLLSNGNSFVVKAHNGQELLEQIATQWNLLVKEGRA